VRVAITGSHGLIGSALARRLRDSGHQVVSLVRGSPGPAELSWAPGRPPALSGFDAVVHLAGAPLGERRWSDAYRAEVMASRREGTATIARAVAEAPAPRPVLVSASAVGYYGSRGPDLLTEDAPAGEGFLAEVVSVWEAAAEPARQAGARVVHPRFGVVLSPAGGALRRQLPLFRLGLGGPMGSGRQYLSWIALDDAVSALWHLVEREQLSGPFNLCSPLPVTQAEFASRLGATLHRPARLRAPAAALRLALGRQMADELLLASQRAIPARLEASGFRFGHGELGAALSFLLR